MNLFNHERTSYQDPVSQNTALADAIRRAGIVRIAEEDGRVIRDDEATNGLSDLRRQALQMPGPAITEVSLQQLTQIRQALTDKEICPAPKGIKDERPSITGAIDAQRRERLEQRATELITQANDGGMGNKLQQHAIKRLVRAYVSHFLNIDSNPQLVLNEVVFKLSDFETQYLASANHTLRRCVSYLNAHMRDTNDFASLWPLQVEVNEFQMHAQHPTAIVRIQVDDVAINRDRAAFSSGRAGHQPDMSL